MLYEDIKDGLANEMHWLNEKIEAINSGIVTVTPADIHFLQVYRIDLLNRYYKETKQNVIQVF